MEKIDKWKPTADHRAQLEELLRLQNEEDSAADFVRKYLPFTQSKWSQILDVLDDKKDGSYFDVIRTPELLMEELAALIPDIGIARKREMVREREGFHRIKQFKAVVEALKLAREERGPERLVTYLAPTGGGKTMLCNYIAEEMSARVVEARTCWRKSYYIFLVDVCRAIGVRIGKENDPAVIEDKLIQFCSDKQVTLAIDEGEYFGSDALNGIKLLLNKTRLVILLCAIPDSYDKWMRLFHHEARQVSRRVFARIELGKLVPEDAEMFFPEGQFAHKTLALKQICESASDFGHYSLVRRVAKKLAGRKSVPDKGTLDEEGKIKVWGVDLAVKRARAEILREI